MNNPLVSIIVPVYNSELTLNRCVDSLLHQSYENFEIILVDDGSTDKSPYICDEYAYNDDRVCSIHKSNGGVASVRAIALGRVKGDYIIHVDSDDWVEPDYIECLVRRAVSISADIVVCDYYYESLNEHLYIQLKNVSTSGLHLFQAFFVSGLHAALWNKLVSKKLIEEGKEYFFSGINYCEDILFWAQILTKEGIRVDYFNKALYHYDNYSNSNSITRRYTSEIWSMRCKYLKKLKELLDNEKFQKEIGISELLIVREGFIYGYLTYKDTRKIILQNRNYIQLLPIAKKKKIGLYLLTLFNATFIKKMLW